MTDHAAGFRQFHLDNPHVYALLVKLARQGVKAGRSKLGIGMLFEVVRWHYTVNPITTTGTDFKLNNNHRAYYARLIMELEDDLADIFELRDSPNHRSQQP